MSGKKKGSTAREWKLNLRGSSSLTFTHVGALEGYGIERQMAQCRDDVGACGGVCDYGQEPCVGQCLSLEAKRQASLAVSTHNVFEHVSSEAKHVYALSTVAERTPQMTSAVSHGAETHKVHSSEASKGLSGLRACFPSARPEFVSLAHTSWEWQQMP